tara:strand:+ start:3526 stop:4413 length:888 start_codon:yes stop_codon:yes gene_type:complete
LKNICVILNPTGGDKDSRKIFNQIKNIFEDKNFGLKLFETEWRGHAFDYGKNLSFNKYDCVCIIGGDGTMHEFLNGMLHREDRRKIPVGLIPGGTGNSFMRDLNCLIPEDAAKRIISGKIRYIDILKIQNEENIYFCFNVVGWGMPTAVVDRAEKLRWFGKQRYNVAAILEIIMNQKRFTRILVDGKEIKGDFGFIMGSNTMHAGNGMKVAPKAKIDDGFIDLIIVKKSSRFKYLTLFPKIFDGTHIKDNIVQYVKVERFSIIPEKNSKLTIDGEVYGSTPISVEIVPRAIGVMV